MMGHEMETPPFQLRKLGHVVLDVTALEASVRFFEGAC
jgi:hypothetical protein